MDAGGPPDQMLGVTPYFVGGRQVNGDTLTVTSLGWLGSSRSAEYVWERCDAGGGGCLPITNAAGPSYALTAADAGMRVRSIVMPTETGRRAIASSLLTGIVAAANPPAAPAPYSLPSDAMLVSTSAELIAALRRSHPRDIVLADGDYDSSGFFVNALGHRIYAQHLGGAVLRAGISVGGNLGRGGGLLRGLAFDVSDRDKTLGGAIVHVWGTGRDTRILDVVLDGHRAVGAGILVRRPEGAVVQRVAARNFLDVGIRVDAGELDYDVGTLPLVADVQVDNVGHDVPRSSNGTSEACVWIGNTAVVRRVRTRGCAWEGVWVGTAAHGALFEDIDVDESGVGVYAEHFVRDSVFRRVRAGPSTDRGITCEWADPSWGRRPACVDDVIEDSVFESRVVGVLLDEGTVRTTVRRSAFVGQQAAALGNYKGIDNLRDTSGNDYSRLGDGASRVTTLHYYEYAGRPAP